MQAPGRTAQHAEACPGLRRAGGRAEPTPTNSRVPHKLGEVDLVGVGGHLVLRGGKDEVAVSKQTTDVASPGPHRMRGTGRRRRRTSTTWMWAPARSVLRWMMPSSQNRTSCGGNGRQARDTRVGPRHHLKAHDWRRRRRLKTPVSSPSAAVPAAAHAAPSQHVGPHVLVVGAQEGEAGAVLIQVVSVALVLACRHTVAGTAVAGRSAETACAMRLHVHAGTGTPRRSPPQLWSSLLCFKATPRWCERAATTRHGLHPPTPHHPPVAAKCSSPCMSTR